MNSRADHIDFDDLINIDLDRAMRRLQRYFLREVLQPEGLGVQDWRALLNLAKSGPCHLRELGRNASMDPTALGKSIRLLEAKALITRTQDPRDARKTVLDTSADGLALVNRIWPQAVSLSRVVRQEIGAEDYTSLQRALKRIQAMELVSKHT